jgi:site-specific recombinase XerD
MFAGNPITFKSLRRSFATWLYENDVDYSLIKDLMGHSKNDVTDFHYIDCKLDKKYRAVCTLQRITKHAKRQSRKGTDVVYYDHNPEVYFEN